MSFHKRLGVIVGVSWVAAAGLFLAGCEVDSASSVVEITPDSVALGSKGQSVTLTAVNGYECTWSLATDTWGMLNTRKGTQVIYTSLYQPSGEVPVIQIVTVASRFTTMSGMEGGSMPAGITNIPSTNISYGTAYITHLPVATSTTTEAIFRVDEATATSLGY